MSSRIIHYYVNENLELVENGEISLSDAHKLIDKYIENQKGLSGSTEYVISKSLFGFSIDVKTFIEIAIDDETNYRVKFECPERKSLVFIKYNTIYQKEISLNDKYQLNRIVDNFFNQDLDSFKKYFNSLLKNEIINF